MTTFIHHPDGYIIVDGEKLPLAFWEIVEPEYALPDGIIGRSYEDGVKHHLIETGNRSSRQADIVDATINGYIGDKTTYTDAYAAYERGANVYRDATGIAVKEIASLTSDKSSILDDGVDAATITCDVAAADYTGQITWRVTAPDGTITTESENMVAGVATLEVTSTQAGAHTIEAETADYGTKSISIEVE